MHSSPMIVRLPSAQDEIWVRWYQRSQEGMSWSALVEHKNLYFISSSGLWFHFDLPYGGYDASGWSFLGRSDDYPILKNYDGGWSSSQGGTTGSGEFACFEVYIKVNESQGTSNGILRTWVNGTLVHETTSYDLRGDSGTYSGNGEITAIQIAQNHNVISNATTQYEDFDDIAIATPSYIGFILDDQGNRMIGPLNNSYIEIQTTPELRIQSE